MKPNATKLFLMMGIVSITACQKMNFASDEVVNSGLRGDVLLPPVLPPPEMPFLPPVEPPTVEPPMVAPPMVEPPMVVAPPVEPPIEPPFRYGTKAEKLAQIEFLSCPVHNESDKLYDYNSSQAPDRSAVFKRILRCTNEAYPETSLAPVAQDTISSLLSEKGDLRQRIYDFLWYRPPFTDHFELYFGLSSLEARQIFCFNQPAQRVLANPLFTTEEARARGGEDTGDAWERDSEAQARYRLVQKYREQLRRCLSDY